MDENPDRASASRFRDLSPRPGARDGPRGGRAELIERAPATADDMAGTSGRREGEDELHVARVDARARVLRACSPSASEMAGPGREGAQEAHQRKSGSQTKKGSALCAESWRPPFLGHPNVSGRASDYLGAYPLPQGRSNASARSRFTPERPLSQLARSDGVGPIALDRLKPAFERVAHPADTVGMLRREIVRARTGPRRGRTGAVRAETLS